MDRSIFKDQPLVRIVDLPRFQCAKCGHSWFWKKAALPKRCPKCNFTEWNKPVYGLLDMGYGSPKSVRIDKGLDTMTQEEREDRQKWFEQQASGAGLLAGVPKWVYEKS